MYFSIQTGIPNKNNVGTSIDVGVWINIECNIGIVSACLPLLRPLFNSDYSKSPAFYLAKFLRSLSSMGSGSGTVENTLRIGSLPEQNGNTRDIEKGHRYQNHVERARSGRQRATTSPRYSRHKTWSDSDDIERMIVEAYHNDEGVSPMEEAEEYESKSRVGSRRSSDEILPDAIRYSYIQAVPESGIGVYDERTDTYNLMPSIALWNRESIMI